MKKTDGRYHRVKSRFWTDEKVRSWDDDTKLLALYILTCPHGNILGCFVLPKPYVCADLGWTEKRLEKPFARLLAEGFMKYDDQANVVLIVNYLKHNPLENPNQVKAAILKLNELPKTVLLQDLKLFGEQLGKPLIQPLIERLGQLYSKPVSVSVTVTDPVADLLVADHLIDGLGNKEKDTAAKEEGCGEEEPARAVRQPKPKVRYADYVSMTEDEYAHLVDRLGSESRAARCIEILNNYKGSTGKRYKSDYLAILNWVVGRLEEEESKKGVIHPSGRRDLHPHLPFVPSGEPGRPP